MRDKKILIFLIVLFAFYNCGTTGEILSTPIESIDSNPIKEVALTDEELKHWSHLDLVKDTVPGMSIDKAYKEIIKNNKGKITI